MTFLKTKIQYVIISVIGLIFLPIFIAKADNINNFSSQITVNTDATVMIKEIIDYDFGNIAKHGIFRDINTENLVLNPVGVSFNGMPNYAYTTSQGINTFNFKIGSADKTIEGLNTYDISYILKGAIRYFSDQDQLYFNVTGNSWTVPITKASAIITLPPGIPKDSIQFKCYTGVQNSRDMNCHYSIDANGSIIFETSKPLNAKEGLTIVVGWPKGFMAQVKNNYNLGQNWSNIILGMGFVLLLATIITGTVNWYRNGRDAKPGPIIITQYEPPAGLTPAEMLYLLHPMNYQYYLSKAFGSTLIDLAYNGYVHIKELPKRWWQRQDYLISETDITKEKRRARKTFEEDFMDYLFSFGTVPASSPQQVKMSQIGKKTKGTDFVKNFENQMAENDLIKPYFQILPKGVNKISTVPITLGIITVGYWIILLKLASIFKRFHSLLDFIVFFTIGMVLLFALYSKLMIKRNDKGLEGYEKCLGFKKYLSVAEKDILSFQAKVKELDYKHIYEKYLPYAIALGVVKEWSNAFSGLITETFDWWQTNSGVYNYTVFSNSLSMFAMSLSQSSATSASSGFSSGGGFSGGGSGGGGGGSW